MIIALDTSILIDVELGDSETIAKLKEITAIHTDPAYIPFISYMEFYYGISERGPARFEKAYSFLQKFPFLTPTKRTAEIQGELRKKYHEKGIILSLADLLIASQVKEHNFILITKDKDFLQIEEIKKIII